MEEKPYLNREIDTFMQEIKDALARIETQTIHTNGSVRSLQLWKARILGLMAGGTMILGLVVYIWNTKINFIDDTINKVDLKIDNHIAQK